jgi:hypothetical protein
MHDSLLSEFNGVIIDGLEFCKRTYKLFEKIRTSPDGPDRLRKRYSLVERKLIAELLPICKYLQVNYTAGRYISIRWIDGNQSFDAELHQSGVFVDMGYYPSLAYLEVTTAMHKNEYLLRQLLCENVPVFTVDGISKTKEGPISKPVLYSSTEHVDKFFPIILKTITKKTKILYPNDTSLVIDCYLNTLYMPDEWDLLVSKIKENMPKHHFKEIILCATTGNFKSTL